MSCRHSVWRSSLIKNLASNTNSITIYISPFSMELLTVSLSDHHRTPDFSSIMSQVSCLSKKLVKKTFKTTLAMKLQISSLHFHENVLCLRYFWWSGPFTGTWIILRFWKAATLKIIKELTEHLFWSKITEQNICYRAKFWRAACNFDKNSSFIPLFISWITRNNYF